MADYTLERQDKRTVVSLTANLTASLVPGLQAALRDALAAGETEVVFDLGNTIMLDSSGIGLLIATSNTLARQKGRIRVVNVSPDILQLLQSMRLTNRLNASGRDS